MVAGPQLFDVRDHGAYEMTAAVIEMPSLTMVDAVKQAANQGEWTEDSLAQAFAYEHRNRLRFCHSRGKWFEFDGATWRVDQRRRALDYARDICRDVGSSRKLGKAATALGVETFARADKTLSACGEDWDSDPMLLGTPGGTVDLRSGELRPPDPSYMITKRTSVAPALGLPQRWLAFLQQATKGDGELVRFMQQLCGYALTGDIREHALFFIHGPGGNGKGVFLNTVTRILGDYAVTAAMETFIASRNDRHSTELAALQGARLVTASETEEGRSWAESRIKQMTGGDPITARFMRQDNFTYTPQFKLVIIGNHEPVLRNVDDAMRRRFNIIPFVHRPAAADPLLEGRLIEEHPQILQWMIDGCQDWLAHGLARPTSVAAQTAQYFEEQDLLAQWLSDQCEVEPHLSEPTGKLFLSWERYAKAAGEYAGKQKAFSAALRKRGFKPDRDSNTDRTRIYRGLRLKVHELMPEQGSGGGPYDQEDRP